MLSFRLEVIDQNGAVPSRAAELRGVEMRGNEVLGGLEEGDWVELDQPADRHGRVKSFRNLTSDVRVRSKRNIFS